MPDRLSVDFGTPRQNKLLAALSARDLERLLPNLQPVCLEPGEVIYESGADLEAVYFPTTAIVSLMYVLVDGSSAEIALVGNDGLVGVALFMGGA